MRYSEFPAFSQIYRQHGFPFTVSRRFEPSSRTTLIGEQPNPWELLHPQDVEVPNPLVDVDSWRGSACYP